MQRLLHLHRQFSSLLVLMLCVLLGWGQSTIYQHDFGTSSISSHPYTVAPGTFDANLSSSSWSNSNSAWTSFAGSSGQAISLSNSSGTPTITLTFDVASGYELEVTSFNFWRRRSSTGAQNWSMTIGGISVGSGSVPTTGSAIGSTNVANAVSGLTGTVSVVISLSGASGTGTFRLDDFTLVGNVTPISSGYTVTFNSNGGSGSMSPQTESSSTALTTNTFTRTGYTFSGWNTASDGSGTAYADGATYSFSADMTIYAQWTINNYTVTFDDNTATSGSPSVASVSGDYNTSVTLATQGTLLKTGYTFAGWNTLANGTGTDYAAGGSYTVTGNVTLYAKWNLITYTVTFDNNGGSGSMTPQTSGVPATLLTNIFARTGYSFSGWNTASDGSGTAYADGATYNFTADATMYAQWTIRNYTVTFNNNGSTSGTPSVGSISGDYLTTDNIATQNTLLKTDHTFDGWNTASDGSGTDYTPGASHTFTANFTLYAKWTLITQDITFNANGGSGSMSNQTIGRGQSANLTANAFTNTGFLFDGWNTASDGSGTDYADGASYTMGTSDVTLYAQWEAPPPAGACDELFFSEYIEGSSNNKCVEIFNGSGSTVNLAAGGYEVQIYNNGNTTPSTTISLSGSIADGDVHVLCNTSASSTFTSISDQLGNLGFNGDDAVALFKGATMIDLIGNIGCDPGTEWSDNGVVTVDKTLVRKSSVSGGITTDPGNTSCPFPTLDAEWIQYNQDFVDSLGTHAGNCATVAEIDVLGNAISITNGDSSPIPGDNTDFGSVEVGGSPQNHSFTIYNEGTDTLFLTGTSPFVSISGTHAADFTVVTPYANDIILAGQSTTFTIEFDPGALGTRNASVSIDNSDADEDPYSFSITGFGSNSLSSDIINESPDWSYPTNIQDYHTDTAATITNSGHSIAVWRFIIRDGGATMNDADNHPTIIDDITFTGVLGLDNIRSAALFSGNALVANSPTINRVLNTIEFLDINSGAGYLARDDNDTTLSLRVSFEPRSITDNEQLRFTLNTTDITIKSTGSSDFINTSINSSTTGNNNRMEVVAQELAFTTQPTDGIVNVNMAGFTIAAQDTFNNLDLDANNAITLTTSGTGMASSSPYTLSGGTVTMSDVQFSTAPQTAITITGTTTGLVYNASTSTSFDIDNVVIGNGDYRTTSSGTWSCGGQTATWERFLSGSWGSHAPPSSSTTDKCYIRNGHTITTCGSFGNGVKIEIQGGGELIVRHQSTALDVEILLNGVLRLEDAFYINSSGGTLTVHDEGDLIIDDEDFKPENYLWQGTENFHPNSNLYVYDIDLTTGYLLSDGGVTTNTYNGYTAGFGNVYIDFDASGDGANLTTDWDGIVGSGLSGDNFCHGNLEFVSTRGNVRYRFAANENVITGIGGNLIMSSGMGSSRRVELATGSSDLNLTIEGDILMNSRGNLWLQATTSIGSQCVFTVKGNIEVNGTGPGNGGTMFMNQNLLNKSAGTVPTCEVNLEGHLSVINGSQLLNNNDNQDDDLWFNFTGDSTVIHQEVNIETETEAIPFYVTDGAYVILKENDLVLADESFLNILAGGAFNFGFDSDNITPLLVRQPFGTPSDEDNKFDMDAGGRIFITHPEGIWMSGSVWADTSKGNVRTISNDNRFFTQTGSYFHYIGRENQETGNAHTVGPTTKDIFVQLLNNDDTLRVTERTGIATDNKLDISSGILENTDSLHIFGGGDLEMTGGGLRSNVLRTTGNVPLMTGDYRITGGFVELFGDRVDQTLRGSTASKPNYYDVKISGNNDVSLGIPTNDKRISSSFTTNHNVYITDGAIFDIENKGMVGPANLTMDENSWLRMSKLNVPLPELSALEDGRPYDLTGGVIEWYGSGATQSQIIRGKDDYNAMTSSQRTIEYWNIEVNAAAANVDDYNVNVDANIEVGNVMNVNSPAVFQLDNDDHIDDVQTPFNAGEFYLQTGATLKYGDDYGITLGSSTGVTAGAIRVTGGGGRSITNFPTTASYGFVSPNDMVTGNGLPATVENLYVDKTNRSGFGVVPEDAAVTLTNSVTVNNTLKMDQGHIITDGNLIELGTSTSDIGTLEYGQDSPQIPGFVIGDMKRWFVGTNSGEASGLFPMGDTVYRNDTSHFFNRHALIEYTSAPTTDGSLVNFYDGETQMALAGLPFASQVAAASGCLAFDVQTTEDEGFWNIDEADGLSGGVYTATLTGERYIEVTDLCGLTLLKRADASSPWTGPGVGTHIASTTISGSTLSLPKVRKTGLTGFSDFGFGGNEDNVLPVELLYYNAYKKVRTSQLEWATSSEVNNEKFIVEHSVNGVNFYPIGQVAGMGTSFTETNYEFLHEQPVSGNNYYRLKQIDFDGSFAYSQIRLVKHEDAYAFAVQVMGNPMTGDDLLVSITAGKNSATTLAIFAADGKLIKYKMVDLEKGTTNHVVDVSDLAEGVYFLSVTNDEMNQGFKIVKSR